MAYYIRVLGTENPNIHLDKLINGLAQEGLNVQVELDEAESPDNWSVIWVSNKDGEELMQIERNPVVEGELGAEELQEFRDEIREQKPASAANWLSAYFDRVKVIYAFELHEAAFEENNNPIISALQALIWSHTGGILQADLEGFTNEHGLHILWQFDDSVTGEWDMSVINTNGEWENFTMELGDVAQREAFWAGAVPKDAVLLEGY